MIPITLMAKLLNFLEASCCSVLVAVNKQAKRAANIGCSKQTTAKPLHFFAFLFTHSTAADQCSIHPWRPARVLVPHHGFDAQPLACFFSVWATKKAHSRFCIAKQSCCSLIEVCGPQYTLNPGGRLLGLVLSHLHACDQP